MYTIVGEITLMKVTKAKVFLTFLIIIFLLKHLIKINNVLFYLEY